MFVSLSVLSVLSVYLSVICRLFVGDSLVVYTMHIKLISFVFISAMSKKNLIEDVIKKCLESISIQTFQIDILKKKLIESERQRKSLVENLQKSERQRKILVKKLEKFEKLDQPALPVPSMETASTQTSQTSPPASPRLRSPRSPLPPPPPAPVVQMKGMERMEFMEAVSVFYEIHMQFMQFNLVILFRVSYATQPTQPKGYRFEMSHSIFLLHLTVNKCLCMDVLVSMI